MSSIGGSANTVRDGSARRNAVLGVVSAFTWSPLLCPQRATPMSSRPNHATSDPRTPATQDTWCTDAPRPLPHSHLSSTSLSGPPDERTSAAGLRNPLGTAGESRGDRSNDLGVYSWCSSGGKDSSDADSCDKETSTTTTA